MTDIFTWGGCEQRTVQFLAGEHIRDRGTKKYWLSGDTPYTDSDFNQWGFPTSKGQGDSPQSLYDDHYDNMMANPGWQLVRASVDEMYHLDDDHEITGGDWDHTLFWANWNLDGPGDTPFANQEAANTGFANARRAMRDAHARYFNNPFPSVVPDEIPKWVADPLTWGNGDYSDPVGGLPPVSDYFNFYFSYTCDVNGTTRPPNQSNHAYFYIDCRIRDPLDVPSIPDNDEKRMITDAAEQQLYADAQAYWDAGVRFFIMCSPKPTKTTNSGESTDTWLVYTTQMARIEKTLWDMGIRSLIWCTGDQHSAAVYDPDVPEEFPCVIGNPVGVVVNNQGIRAINGWVYGDLLPRVPNSAGQNAFRSQVVAELRIDSQKIDLEIYRTHDESQVYKATMLKGESTFTYQEPQVVREELEMTVKYINRSPDDPGVTVNDGATAVLAFDRAATGVGESSGGAVKHFYTAAANATLTKLGFRAKRSPSSAAANIVVGLYACDTTGEPIAGSAPIPGTELGLPTITDNDTMQTVEVTGLSIPLVQGTNYTVVVLPNAGVTPAQDSSISGDVYFDGDNTANPDVLPQSWATEGTLTSDFIIYGEVFELSSGRNNPVIGGVGSTDTTPARGNTSDVAVTNVGGQTSSIIGVCPNYANTSPQSNGEANIYTDTDRVATQTTDHVFRFIGGGASTSNEIDSEGGPSVPDTPVTHTALVYDAATTAFTANNVRHVLATGASAPGAAVPPSTYTNATEPPLAVAAGEGVVAVG